MKKYKTNLTLFAVFIAIVSLSVYGFYLIKGVTQFDLSKIQSPKSYKELYDIMKSQSNKDEELIYEDVAPDASKGLSSGDFSRTNIQVSGVDEADIVKTDGNYIYSLADEYLYIIEANDGVMNVVSKIKANASLENGASHYQEIYIRDNKLLVIKNISMFGDYYPIGERTTSYLAGSNSVAVVVFDVTNKTKPVKINELSQSGYYVSSRLVDNYLYVTTNYQINSDFSRNDIRTYVPTLTTKETAPIAINDIIVAPNPNTNSYITVTGMDINDSSEYKSSKAVLGSSNNIYADADSLYIATSSNSWNSNYSETNIIKFSMNKGLLNLVANGSVKGTILNQFSMDEYDDNFRIVTTYYDYDLFGIDDVITPGDEEEDTTKNNLYVLDKDLKLIGKIEGLAKGERIYSVRFDNEVAYFVTFKQVDPLFVVDLTDPKTPIVKSELKIPGFSEYLHVFNEKYLFGLGKEANDNGTVTGLKISMYDIQNKSDVTEKYKLIIGDKNSWTEASYNHKAVLISSAKNLIAFPMNDSYLVYKFTDNVGFEKLGEITYDTEVMDYYYYSGNNRGLYINDYLYVVNQRQVSTFNLKTLEYGDVLELVPIKKNEDLLE